MSVLLLPVAHVCCRGGEIERCCFLPGCVPAFVYDEDGLRNNTAAGEENDEDHSSSSSSSVASDREDHDSRDDRASNVAGSPRQCTVRRRRSRRWQVVDGRRRSSKDTATTCRGQRQQRRQLQQQQPPPAPRFHLGDAVFFERLQGVDVGTIVEFTHMKERHVISDVSRQRVAMLLRKLDLDELATMRQLYSSDDQQLRRVAEAVFSFGCADLSSDATPWERAGFASASVRSCYWQADRSVIHVVFSTETDFRQLRIRSLLSIAHRAFGGAVRVQFRQLLVPNRECTLH